MRIPRHIARATVAGLLGILVSESPAAPARATTRQAARRTRDAADRHSDPRDYPAGDAIEEFARRVNTLSEGKIRIRPVWQAAGVSVTQSNQRVARLVVSGELDLGMTPFGGLGHRGRHNLARAAGTVSHLDRRDAERGRRERPQRQPARRPGEVGVEGLALIPEALRHPVGFDARAPVNYGLRGSRHPRSALEHNLRTSPGTRGPAHGLDLRAGRFRAPSRQDQRRGVELLHLGSLRPPGLSRRTSSSSPRSTHSWRMQNGSTSSPPSSRKSSATPRSRHSAMSSTRGRTRWMPLARPAGTAPSSSSRARPTSPRFDAQPRPSTQTSSVIRPRRSSSRRSVRLRAPSAPASAASCGRRRAAPAPSATAGVGGAQPTIPEGAYRAEITFDEMVARGVDLGKRVDERRDHDLDARRRALAPQYARPAGSLHGQVLVLGQAGGLLADDIPSCGTARGLVLFSAVWSLHDGSLRFTRVRAGEGDTDLFARALWGSEPWRKVS